MTARKGFTLIELCIVLIILGIIAALILPNILAFMEQSKAQSVKNNLLAIAAAEEKYNEDWGHYCTSTTFVGSNTVVPYCGDTVPHLTTNLHLNFSTNDSFYSNYACTPPPGSGPASSDYYQCTTNDGTDYLTLDVSPTGGAVVSCTPNGCSLS